MVALTATLAVAAAGAAARGEPSADPAAVASSNRPDRNGRIVFQRLDPKTGKVRLYTIRPDGSHMRAVSLPPAGSRDVRPDWSPSGR